MNHAGVWSFRTTTGVARVVNGSLRRRSTLRGFVFGFYKRFGSGSVVKNIFFSIASVGAFGPIRTVVESVLAKGLVAGVASAGLGAILITTGTAVMVATPIRSLVGRSETVDIYDITDVTVDAEDCELTIQHTDENDDHETTTVELYDEEELEEAIEILQLKGASVDSAVAEKWGVG